MHFKPWTSGEENSLMSNSNLFTVIHNCFFGKDFGQFAGYSSLHRTDIKWELL